MKLPKNNPNGKYELGLLVWNEYLKKFESHNLRTDKAEDLETFYNIIKNTKKNKKKHNEST